MQPTADQLARLRSTSNPELLISDAAWEKAVPLFRCREADKDEYLLRAGRDVFSIARSAQ